MEIGAASIVIHRDCLYNFQQLNKRFHYNLNIEGQIDAEWIVKLY